MFSKPTEPRSIASQLVLLFTLAAALLFCCGLCVLYWIVVQHTFEEDNVALADKISALRADLSRAGPEPQHEKLKILRAENSPYWVRIVDSENHTVTETPGMSELLPPNIFLSPEDATTAVRNGRDHRTAGKLFTLIAIKDQANGQSYAVQVGQDRSPDDEFTKHFAFLLAVALVAGILASALVAVTVTRRGLQPLAEMTQSLSRIGPTHLSERVAPAGWPRELQPLAIAFDEMLNRLETSFTRLSQFSADLAHELRTPIANIRGEAEVALTRARAPEEYREVIESIVAECARLSAIVDSLLFLARAEAAEGHLQKTLFDGRSAIEKIAAYYGTIAEERSVTIKGAGQGEIYADEMLFGRAVNNLVDNALRFTPDGGTILISIAVQAGNTEVSVKDSGGGIAAEHLPRVFDRFYRVDPARSSQGAGLGLALVKSIAELHGGSAQVQSEIGRGTTVIIRFPNKPDLESKV